MIPRKEKRRITIMLDNDLLIKMKRIQAKQIRELNENVSFSKVINNILRKGLKK